MRHRSYGRLDDAPVHDGDTTFIGVDERDPAQVRPGFVSEAVNLLFRNGVAEPRRGCVSVAWLNGEGGSWPWHFTPPPEHSFEVPKPIAAEVVGGAVFRDADDLEWVILAANPQDPSGATQVWRMREGYKPSQVAVPADMPRLRECSFTQCFNKLIMFRGKQYPALEMADVRSGFASIAQTESETDSGYNAGATTSTETIPQATHGLFLQNRLFVPHSRDLIAASDFLNYTRYSPTRADFRINQGSADELVALVKLGENTIVAFKSQSVYLVHNVYGDLSELRLEELTKSFGLAARRAVVTTGQDVWFLSEKGITSIALARDNKVKSEDKFWSDPIPRTWARINWRLIDRATAVFHDGLILWAVPLDRGTKTTVNGHEYSDVNNAVLVFDTKTGAWAGVHEGDNLMVKEWLQFTWRGQQRLGFVSEDGLAYLWGATFSDKVRPGVTALAKGVTEIRTRLVTRAYAGQATAEMSGERMRTQVKRWSGGIVVLETWRPSYGITAKVDGVNETDGTSGRYAVRDRRKWFTPFDRPDYDLSNVNGDHGDPGRQDYSVNCTRGGAVHLREQASQILLGDGVNFEQHQETPVSVRLNRQGRWVQLEITNMQGRALVRGVSVEGRLSRRRGGVLV